MSADLPFSYREFYDVPRDIVLAHRGMTLLLESEFDDAIDDYAADYTVYLLPPDIDLSGSWASLPKRAMRVVGKIPVLAVRFDPSRRAFIDSAAFEDFATTAGWW